MSTRFYPLKVAEVRRETPEAVSIILEPPAEVREAFHFEAGQHLTFRREFAGEDVRRNYSLCVAPSEGRLRIGVKQTAGGLFSTFVNTELKAGDVLEAMVPHGSFTWRFDPEAKRRYLAFVGGSGITPILSLLKTALGLEPRSRFTLLYGNRASTSIMFLEEIAGLKDRYLDRLQVFHFLEEEAEEIELFNGRLDADKCRDVLDALIDAERLDAVFLCGPEPMMQAAEAALTAKGVPADKIKVERFTTGAPSAARSAEAEALVRQAAGMKMTVQLDGRRFAVTFDPEKGSILESVRAAGHSAPFACKGGVCATCRAKITAGSAEMRANYALSPEEVAEGYILTCQAAPTSEGVVLSYDG
ncbi:MAG: 1,2-phenylacetyl-CoA epoxidase subunit PaaE [Caulobacteraceae bacterium]